MKYILIFLLILIAQSSFAQKVDSISKIIFKYSKGNAWGDTLIVGKEEVIEITPTSRDDFRISKQLEIIYYGKPDWRKDTIKIKTNKYLLLSRNKIEYLIAQLNTTKDNFNITFIKPRLIAPKRKEIIAVAKSDTNDYWKLLDRDYLEKSERKTVLKKIEHFDKLDSFILLKKPNPRYVIVMSDAWDGLGIYCIKNADTLCYFSHFYNLLGQGFARFKKNKSRDTTFVNLEMNTSIENILPKKSFLRKNIDINGLTDQYIRWYLKEGIK